MFGNNEQLVQIAKSYTPLSVIQGGWKIKGHCRINLNCVYFALVIPECALCNRNENERQ